MYELVIHTDGCMYTARGPAWACLAFLNTHRGGTVAMYRHDGPNGICGEVFKGAVVVRAELERVGGGRARYAAGYRGREGGFSFFAGPECTLDTITEHTPPPSQEEELHAYIVELNGNKMTPLARWRGGKWCFKKEQK